MDNHLIKSFELKNCREVELLLCKKKTHFDNKKPISAIRNQLLLNYQLVSKVFVRKKVCFDKKKKVE